MICRCQALAKSLVLGCLAALLQVNAQGMRDPTVPPAVAGLSGAQTEVRAPDFGIDIVAVIVREGQPYLVQGSRLYGQGQKVGQTLIERITETAVWLREDGVLRKQPLFPGIQLHMLPSNALSPAGSPRPSCAQINVHCSSQKIEKSAP